MVSNIKQHVVGACAFSIILTSFALAVGNDGYTLVDQGEVPMAGTGETSPDVMAVKVEGWVPLPELYINNIVTRVAKKVGSKVLFTNVVPFRTTEGAGQDGHNYTFHLTRATTVPYRIMLPSGATFGTAYPQSKDRRGELSAGGLFFVHAAQKLAEQILTAVAPGQTYQVEVKSDSMRWFGVDTLFGIHYRLKFTPRNQ